MELLDSSHLSLQKLTSFVKNEKAKNKNSIDKDLKELEKKHKVKLSEEAREDLLKWYFDIERAQKKPEVKE